MLIVFVIQDHNLLLCFSKLVGKILEKLIYFKF